MTAAEKVVEIPYTPRPLQRKLHNEVKRFNVLVCHRRFGKTLFTIQMMLKGALTCPLPNPRFLYLAPLRSQSKVIAWDYVKEYARHIPGVKFNEQELRADFPNGGRITLAGALDIDNLRGGYFDGVVLDEFAQMSPRVWSEVCRPAMSDRAPYSWAVFIGTPQGEDNSFYDIYQHAVQDDNWYAAMYKASETGLIDEDELADAKRSMTPSQYQQEFECSFSAAIQGAIYGDQIEKAKDRICSVPHDRNALVHVSFDLGMGDATALWFFQEIGREIHFIDCYQNTGMALDHYVKYMRAKKEYSYGRFIFPHDVQVRELSSGVSRFETLQNLGVQPTVAKRTGPEERINAARMQFDKIWFDKEKCREGLQALRAYRYEFNDKTRQFRPKPRHDFASHYSDSFGTAMENIKLTRPRGELKPRDRSWIV